MALLANWCPRRSGAKTLYALLAVPQVLVGQSVRGHVIDSLTDAPVGRGFVVLLDEQGGEHARVLTTSRGEFFITAPRRGYYRIRSEVIAYRMRESALLLLEPGPAHELPLRIQRIPMRLDAVEVIGRERCAPPNADLNVSTVWDEARKALAAAAWTGNRQEYRHLLHRYQRVESRRSELRREEIWVVEGTASQPFASIDPQRLVHSGYVVDRGDRRQYFGPDANVLLHDGFQETHCFWAVRGTGAFAGMIGLAFAPVPEREQPDIAGTLWLDPETAELIGIEYRYTDLPFPFEDERLGGSIDFTRMASGAWILSRWELRTPVVEEERRMTAPGVIGTRLGLGGLQLIGGEVIVSTDRAGRVEYQSADIVQVRGLVYDSSRSAVAAGAQVSVAGTGYSAVTDTNGRFEFATLLRGPYELTTARLDSLAFDRGRVPVTAVPRQPLDVVIVQPRLETVYRYHCGTAGIGGAERVIVGSVLDVASRLPIGNVPIEVSWQRGAALNPETRRTRTRDDGSFAVCPLPARRELTLTTRADNYDPRPIVVEFADGVVTVNDGSRPIEWRTSERIIRVDVMLTATRN